MLSIQQFNQKLNYSYDAAERHQMWQDYRSQITAHLDIEAQSMLIIGAGHLNDIEMSDMLLRVGAITLLDVDISAIKRGLKIQKIDQSRVRIVERDLTGLDQDYFFERVVYLLQNSDFTGLKMYFDEVVKNMVAIQLADRFDCIVISSIYTQLLLTQYYSLINLLLEPELIDQALEPFMTFISQVIHAVNKNILGLASGGARIVVWSDVLEYDKADISLEKIKYAINKKYDQAIDKLYEDYLEKYGHGLGTFGLLDIKEQLHVESKSWLLWPFSDKRTMLVKLLTGTT